MESMTRKHVAYLKLLKLITSPLRQGSTDAATKGKDADGNCYYDLFKDLQNAGKIRVHKTKFYIEE